MDTIQFFIIVGSRRISYFFKKNELFSTVIKKFEKDLKIFPSGYKSYYNFYCNSHPIEQNKTLKELNIDNFSQIEVVETKLLPGAGFSLNFTDVSKNIYEEHYFSETAPDYRIASKGINVYGICKGKKCKAYNMEVICPLIDKIIFNLLEERDDLECPICGGLIVPKTLGFFCCEYKIKGKKCENDKIIPFELRDKASNKNSMRYFNPDKNGRTIFTELIVEVIKFL